MIGDIPKVAELLRLTQVALFKPCSSREPYFNASEGIHLLCWIEDVLESEKMKKASAL